MDIWQEKLTIVFTDVDPSGNITLSSVFDYFQKASVSHAEALGVGRLRMAAAGQVWILSRLSVVIERRPRLDETIVLRTWPCGFNKLFAVRDYDMSDAAGNCLVRGRSHWLLVDIEKRRPLRPQSLVVPLPRNEGLEAMRETSLALEQRENLCFIRERQAEYADIDFNAHVNNARYVQWLEDMAGHTVLENAARLRLDINYMGEVSRGETISFFAARFDETADGGASYQTAFEGRRKEGGQPVLRAELRASTRT